jgi:hypothetical protein
MTHEQTRIVNYNVQPGEIIKIVAFAGKCKLLNLKNLMHVFFLSCIVERCYLSIFMDSMCVS